VGERGLKLGGEEKVKKIQEDKRRGDVRRKTVGNERNLWKLERTPLASLLTITQNRKNKDEK